MKEKKTHFLKRHPLIPAIFFLGMAWGILYMITSNRGKYNLSAPNSPNSFDFQHKNPLWKLQIRAKGMTWKVADSSQEMVFSSPPRIEKVGNAKEILIFEATHQNKKTKVNITKVKDKVQSVWINDGGNIYEKETSK
jgi:hypothetical protein